MPQKGKRTKPNGKEGWALAAYAQYFVQTCSTEDLEGGVSMGGMGASGRTNMQCQLQLPHLVAHTQRCT